MKKMNKLVALLLAAVMVLGMMPTVTVHAAEHNHTHTPAVEVNGIEEYPALTADTPATATFANTGDVAYFTFTPEKTDLYYFYSTADTDTKGYIYDADMGFLNYNDDSSYGPTLGIWSPNFCVEQVMEAGVTYILTAQPFQSTWTGEFTVTVMTGHSYTSEVTKEATCSEDGVLTYTCSYCGESYDEAIPAAHKYSDETGKCIFCDELYLVTGTCGDALTWELDYFGTLTIKGTGDMYNYANSWEERNPAPWYEEYANPYEEEANRITKLVVEEGVTSIGSYAFYYCQYMTEVSLPSTLTTLGSNSFSSCYGLTEVTLPDAITTIPDSCFYYCGSLSKVNWPANLTTVEDNAFYNCNLPNLVLPEGITTLGQYAFGGNGEMTKLTLPSTLTNVADYAFASMWNTKDFVFKGDAPTFGGSSVFRYVTANAWYPDGNETWTDEVKQNYGGTVTWKAACSGSHTWGDAVTVPATCETGSYMTMTCTVCGYTEVSPENDDALGHDYQTEHYDGGCGNSSYDIITCSRCDYRAQENWVWNEHDYVQSHVDATCEIGGYDVFTCSLCGDFYESNYTAPLGHDVAEWSEPTEATCTEDGVKTGHCARCDLDVSEVVTAALGHEWDMENGTVNADGTTTYPCIRCDATYTTEGPCLFEGDNQFTIEANTVTETKTYTATADGTLTIYVSDLYYANGEGGWNTMAIDFYVRDMGAISIKVNGENANYTVVGKETAAKLILNTIEVKKDDVVTVELAHTSESWHTNKDVRFNVNLALASAHTHAYTAVVTEPTCTEYGYTTYICECGDSYVDEDSWTEPEHKWDDGVVTEPTCTAQGYTTFTCTVCNESYIDEDSYTEPEHNFVNGDCTRCDAVLKATFDDVPAGAFYFDPVEWAVKQGITTGATETTFDPSGDLQRAQVVVMLWRAAGEPEPTITENPFNDVTEADFFYKAVLWAVEKNITNGTSATEFSPYGVTNRAQAVTFLWRYLENPESTTTNSFTDVVAGEWYEAAINWAVENEVTNGMADGTFGITTNCNRAHMVTFMYRALAD